MKTRNVKKMTKTILEKKFMTTSATIIQTTSNNENQISKCLINKVNHASISMTTTTSITTSTKTKTTTTIKLIMTMTNVIHRLIQSINQCDPLTNINHRPMSNNDQCYPKSNVIQCHPMSSIDQCNQLTNLIH